MFSLFCCAAVPNALATINAMSGASEPSQLLFLRIC